MGVIERRVFPTICVQRCRVAYVSFHSFSGRLGQRCAFNGLISAGRLSDAERFWAELDLIGVAPSPVFARLQASHDRVVRRVGVFGRVYVRRRVTAADVSAAQAETKMYPAASHSKTFLATVGIWGNASDLPQMAARDGHGFLGRMGCPPNILRAAIQA